MTFWKSFRIVSFGTILLSPAIVFAQTALTNSVVPKNCQGADAATKCGVCDLAQLAQNILNTAIFVLIVLSAVMFAWAGWKMLSSGGNSSEYAAGKRIFGNVIIGLLIVLGAWVVIDTLMKTLVRQNSSFGPWNKICLEIEGIFEHHYA
jgi:hypothetical protein